MKAVKFAFIGGLLLLFGLLSAPLEVLAQGIVAYTVLALIYIFGQESWFHHKYSRYCRLIVLIIGLALTVRYIIWRGAYTMVASDWISFIAMWMLFLAEIYAAITHILGCIVNSFPLQRPLRSVAEFTADELPTVDILIPTYNEQAELLEITIRAAKQIDYPQDKLSIHLLDDGGTDAKCAQQGQLGIDARARRKEMQALANTLNVTYHTRATNELAKAGNINSALLNTSGDMVVVLDADHVPTTDFLDKTVPWLIGNDDVFLVQSPHFMANPDPVERNYFSAFSRMPSENDMFYGTIQKGLDHWQASFFCGSAAVLRRKHLMLVGGISGESITEDAETALDLHAKGLQSVYVDYPLVSGLTPDTVDGFVTQRMRWAQGMTQILLLKRPFANTKLSWHQRMGYMSSMLFWQFPFARLIFLLIPLAYLIFGMSIYHASFEEILAYTIPHVVATYMVSTMLFGRTRWPLVSELYELLQSTFALQAITQVFLRPHSPKFNVTPKYQDLKTRFVSPMSTVFYWLLFALLAGMAFGIGKLIYDPLTRELTSVVLIWNTFNVVLLLGVLSVLIEQPQGRKYPRLPCLLPGSVDLQSGMNTEVNLINMSVSGACLQLQENTSQCITDALKRTNKNELIHLHVNTSEDEADSKTQQDVNPVNHDNVDIELPCKIVDYSPRNSILHVEFQPENEQQKDQIISFTLGSSARWHGFQRRRTRPISYWFGAKRVLQLSIYPIFTHLKLNFLNFRAQLWR